MGIIKMKGIVEMVGIGNRNNGKQEGEIEQSLVLGQSRK